MNEVELLPNGCVIRRLAGGAVQLVSYPTNAAGSAHGTAARDNLVSNKGAGQVSGPLPPKRNESQPPRRVPFTEYARQQIWGPVIWSARCPACKMAIEHAHGYYAPIGGE